MRFTWTVLFPISLLLSMSLAGCRPPVNSDVETVDGESSVEVTLPETGESDSAAEEDLQSDEESTPVISLNLGDKAPPVSITQAVTGNGSVVFQPGKIHVVEFWATWCPPCRTSIPHISQLQEKYSDEVTFLGVTSEKLKIVEKFLDKATPTEENVTWREVIKYTMVLDDRNQTNAAYMRATKSNGIPTAFIVDREGLLQWYGHPMKMDDPLEKIVNGKWSLDAAKEEFAAAALRDDLDASLQAPVRDGDYEEALRILDASPLAQDPDVSLNMTRYQLLSLADRHDEAIALKERLEQPLWEDADKLNELAWFVAADCPQDGRDLEWAKKLAERSSALSDEKSANTLDTLAKVLYEMGDLDLAIEHQKRAVKLDKSLQETLDQYLIERAKNVQDAAEATDETGDTTEDESEDANVGDDSSEAHEDSDDRDVGDDKPVQ